MCSSSTWDYDVVIVGGGVVGSTLAVSLMRNISDIRIAIIEKSTPKLLDSIYKVTTPDMRVYALSPSSISILKDIGAWEDIEKRSQPYTSMQIWEYNGPGLVRFNSAQMSVPELGRIVEDVTIQVATKS
jgi:2-octaprenylphenol hydroxylase